VFISGQTQAPFSNITLDFIPPRDLLDENPIIGGKKMGFTYRDCQEEMNRFNRILFEVFEEGDSVGNLFQYPIITVNCGEDFFENIDPKVEELLYRITAKYGTPYFSNFIGNTDMSIEDVRSMCAEKNGKVDIEFDEDCIEAEGRFYNSDFNKFYDGNQRPAFYGRGEKMRVSISSVVESNAAIKVKTKDGYEIPKEKIKTRFAGKLVCISLSDGTVTKVIPSHECLVVQNNALAEKKAMDVKPGDYFQNEKGEKCMVAGITSEDYDGYVYSFRLPSRSYYLDGFLTKNCCRLRLDLREIRKRGGGLFGSAEKTGSIGVVSINLPKIGYLSHTEGELFERLGYIMDIARKSLFIKRKRLQKNLDNGLYPYTLRYLGSLDNHFSTIGIVGMNELLLNFKPVSQGIGTPAGKSLAVKILNFMRGRIADYQEEDKNILYNLESTPAESTCYRLALHDKKKYPDIITAGTLSAPYYTNSSNLPVGYTDDPWEAIRNQEDIQTLYSGGTVFHVFLGEKIDDWRKVKDFVKKVCYGSKLPYVTISPVFSHCPVHGYLPGDTKGICPRCKEEAIEEYKKAKLKLEMKKAEILGC
jgi:ribonucleoside-triphosphate reductase